jgi:hypothetical protein
MEELVYFIAGLANIVSLILQIIDFIQERRREKK